MKVLIFDSQNVCRASLSRKTIKEMGKQGENFLENIRLSGGNFIDCPVEMVAMISGKEEQETLNTIFRDIKKF